MIENKNIKDNKFNIIKFVVYASMFFIGVSSIYFFIVFLLTINNNAYRMCTSFYFLLIIAIVIICLIFWKSEILKIKSDYSFVLLKNTLIIFLFIPLIFSAIYFCCIEYIEIIEFLPEHFWNIVYLGIAVAYLICYCYYRKKKLLKELKVLIKCAITVASIIVYFPLILGLSIDSEKIFSVIFIVFIVSDFDYFLYSEWKN